MMNHNRNKNYKNCTTVIYANIKRYVQHEEKLDDSKQYIVYVICTLLMTCNVYNTFDYNFKEIVSKCLPFPSIKHSKHKNEP